MVFKISKRQLEFLVRLAERKYPRESCAVLLGRHSGELNAIVKCANVHPEPLHHYVIDPRELIRIQRLVRSFGLQIVGFHHSHPEHEAEPSETDLEEANWPGCLYLITSVHKHRAVASRTFLLHQEGTGKAFQEVVMVMREDESPL